MYNTVTQACHFYIGPHGGQDKHWHYTKYSYDHTNKINHICISYLFYASHMAQLQSSSMQTLYLNHWIKLGPLWYNSTQE